MKGDHLGSGADPKVVQRILGHASGAMTVDLYAQARTAWKVAAPRNILAVIYSPSGQIPIFG